jgi:hypothetical protein
VAANVSADGSRSDKARSRDVHDMKSMTHALGGAFAVDAAKARREFTAVRLWLVTLLILGAFAAVVFEKVETAYFSSSNSSQIDRSGQ